MAIEDLRYFMAVGMGISHYHKAPVNTDVVLLVSGDTCEWPSLLQRMHEGACRLACSAQCRQLPQPGRGLVAKFRRDVCLTHGQHTRTAPSASQALLCSSCFAVRSAQHM